MKFLKFILFLFLSGVAITFIISHDNTDWALTMIAIALFRIADSLEEKR